MSLKTFHHYVFEVIHVFDPNEKDRNANFSIDVMSDDINGRKACQFVIRVGILSNIRLFALIYLICIQAGTY